jgi:hypothetical protein
LLVELHTVASISIDKHLNANTARIRNLLEGDDQPYECGLALSAITRTTTTI